MIEKISADRLWTRLMTLAEIGASQTKGEVNRQALSDLDAQAVRQTISWAAEAGLRPWLDQAGNLFLCCSGQNPNLPPILAGSHLDSQPTGGRFDGALGVMAALEAAISLKDQPRLRDLWVVAWSNEEGSRFAPGMTGSEVFTGGRSLSEIDPLMDQSGISLGQARQQFLTHFPDLAVHPTRPIPEIGGYIELHIEQAALLETAGAIVGAVSAIQGKITWEVSLIGSEAHAGTEPMARRRDALMAFSKIAATLYDQIPAFDPAIMFTIGRLDIAPNAPSVVPARATFRIDLRHADDAILQAAAREVEAIIRTLAPPCGADIKQLSNTAPNSFSQKIQKDILRAAEGLGLKAQSILSYAGHDARHLAKLTPNAAMIFVPCRNGLSHHPDEWCEKDHAAAGTLVLARVLETLLNEGGDRDGDVAA